MKIAYQNGEDPRNLAALRFAIAGTLAVPTLIWRSRRAGRRVPLRALGLQVAGGIILFAGAFGELEGLARLPAAILILLIFVAPVWVTAIEWIARRARPARTEAVAAAAVISGVCLMANPVRGSIDLVGLAAGLAASLGFASFLVLMKSSEETSDVGFGICVALIAAGVAGTMFQPNAFDQLGRLNLLPYVVSVGIAVWLWARCSWLSD